MDKQSIKTYQEFSEDKITKRVIYNNDSSTAFVLNFYPGQKLPAHKHLARSFICLWCPEAAPLSLTGKK